MKHRQSDKKQTTKYLLGIVLMGCTLSGCDRTEIHSYRVEREFRGTTAPVPQDQQQQEESPQLHVIWDVPSTWKEVETTVSMRLVTFIAANGQEIAVSAFPGDVGGLIANVNRWRGQVGLDETDEAGIEEVINRLDGVDVIIVDVASGDTRLVGSIIDVGDGQTWFVKAIGPAEKIDQVKADLVVISTTFRIHDHDHEGADTQEEAVELAIPTSSSGWEQPAEWTVEKDASPILMAAFNADGGARITLTSLVGQGGGMLDNINRWRGQLGLDQVPTMAEQPTRDLGDGAVFVDLVSPDEASRMAAAIVPMGAQSLYFKLTGTHAQVEEELGRFETYINAEGLGKAVSP